MERLATQEPFEADLVPGRRLRVTGMMRETDWRDVLHTRARAGRGGARLRRLPDRGGHGRAG